MTFPNRSVCGLIAGAFAAVTVLTFCLALVAEEPMQAPKSEVKPPANAIPPGAQAALNQFCIGCHGEKKQQGKIRFDALATLNPNQRLDLFNKAQAALHFREMPPEDERQPSAAERKALADWVRSEVVRLGGSDLVDKLRYPDYGNAVDHDKLFSGEIKDKPFSPARRWLVNPQIFHERVMDVFQLNPKDRELYTKQNFYGVTSPFILPDHSGVRDYDLGVLDGGHLLVMLANAKWISNKQIFAARNGNKAPKDMTFVNPKDRWYPIKTSAAFEAILKSETAPTDQQLVDAIQTQFECVLQRKASDAELKKYLKMARSAVEVGGNVEGLRQVLVAVLLESEFLYRLEFGAGEPDAHGRRMLSPREASYAISYALGDRKPDAELVKAANEGRLKTRDDYRREVVRLLGDDNYYRGQIDKTLNGLQFKSSVTSHPRLVRFFREFFGYPGALKLFKDKNRSDGYYENPDRGSTATPGHLVLEADMIVDWYVKQDKDVFEKLLTTEKFFVAPVDDAVAKMDMLDKFYDRFKDTEWKTNPKKVTEDNLEYIQKALHYKAGEKQFKEAMIHATKFREKGLRPHPVWSYAFGTRLTMWVASYNIDSFNWNYPPEQPFELPNRKGILTHPAWLIAHASNSATDPVRRGRWIREKLLAGRVPDVPITVDAQIPEDPHRTLRERLESVTTKQECWKCHQHMNPLGVAFEMYDDFGRFRTKESLEHPDSLIAKTKTKYGADLYKTKPVQTTGQLSGTGDPKLDGDVKDALDMIDRLAKSERVRQSIIRHAFRFFMGRNEMLSDSQTLIDADRAYVQSGGSFRAVVVSLLTSDSFIYRKNVTGDALP